MTASFTVMPASICVPLRRWPCRWRLPVVSTFLHVPQPGGRDEAFGVCGHSPGKTAYSMYPWPGRETTTGFVPQPQPRLGFEKRHRRSARGCACPGRTSIPAYVPVKPPPATNRSDLPPAATPPPRFQSVGNSAADRGVGLSGIQGPISGQQAGIPTGDMDRNLRKLLFQCIQRSHMVIVSMGQQDPRNRLSNLIRRPQNPFQAVGSAASTRVNSSSSSTR